MKARLITDSFTTRAVSVEVDELLKVQTEKLHRLAETSVYGRFRENEKESAEQVLERLRIAGGESGIKFVALENEEYEKLVKEWSLILFGSEDRWLKLQQRFSCATKLKKTL